MTAKPGNTDPTSFQPGSDEALPIFSAQRLWKRMIAEHETLGGRKRDTRWLLDESNRLRALSRELQHHSAALSRSVAELLKSQTPAADHAKHEALFEICRSSMALINEARAMRHASATGRTRADGLAKARLALTRPAAAEAVATGSLDAGDSVG